MSSFPIGLIAAIVILIYSLGSTDAKTFINAHALVLVLGGTFAVLALSTPIKDLIHIWRSVQSIFKPETSLQLLQEDLNQLSRSKKSSSQSGHELMIYAQTLWEKGVDSQMFMALLGRKMEEMMGSTEQSIALLRNLAKYPPALGMTGTVIGLVSLFSNLTPENKTSLGPLLALAMTATFYGLILSNILLMPLADRIQVMHITRAKEIELVFKVILLIHQNEAKNVIEDEIYGRAA